MAKRTARKVARGVSLSSAAAVREAAGGEARKDTVTGFRIPSVRGMRPAISSDPVDLEAGRFTNGGAGSAPFPSSRRVSQAALEAAQRRMHGVRIEPEDVVDDEDDEDDNEGDTPVAFEVDGSVTAALNKAMATAAQFTKPEPRTKGRAFTLPIQVAHPAPPKPKQDGLSLALVTIEDVDQLWDWLRQDADRGGSFFLQPPANSVELHKLMGALVMHEGAVGGHGLVRTINYTDTVQSHHLGFVMLAPVLLAEGIAVLHVYLRKDVRPRLLDVSLDLMDEIAALVPGLQLAVYGAEAQWESVLAPLGFTKHTMFVR